ncbi:MAG: hypothetical protein AAGF26_04105, partial [Cyanobacteria bacterium P01_G01_bin.49]
MSSSDTSNIQIPENLKEHNAFINHVNFWTRKIESINSPSLEKEKEKKTLDDYCISIRNNYTNYQQLAQSIQAVQSYSASWRVALQHILQYQTTIKALQWQQINHFSISSPTNPDPIKNQIEASKHWLNYLNQLQSIIELLEVLLLQAIKVIYLLGKQENYSSKKILDICRAFCEITLTE